MKPVAREAKAGSVAEKLVEVDSLQAAWDSIKRNHRQRSAEI